MGALNSYQSHTRQVGSAQRFASELEQLGQTYCARLPGQITALKQVYGSLYEGGWNQPAADELYQIAHNLAGCGGFFGFPSITKQARVLLEQLTARKVDENGLTASIRDELELGFGGLLQAMNRAGAKSAATNHPEILEKIKPDNFQRAHKLVYIIDNDEVNADFEALLVRELGYQVETFQHPEEITATAGLPTPNVIVMGTLFPKTSMRGIEFLSNLRARLGARVPVIFLSASADSVTRLRAFRAGGDAYLQKPADPDIFSRLLDELAGVEGNTSYKVLFSCHDGHSSAELVTEMTELGHSVLSIGGARSNMAVIRAFDPDCVVCTSQLNDCRAAELASGLRRQPELMCLPFLIVQEEHDAVTLDAVAGQDFQLDRVFSPQKNDLNLSLRRAVRRSRRLIHKIAEITRRDPRTGMLNRRFFWSDLEQAVAAAGPGSERRALIHVTVQQNLSDTDCKIQRLPPDAPSIIHHCLRAILTASDSVAQLSDCVYGIIAADRLPADNLILAERVCNAVEAIELSNGEQGKSAFTCSAGVAQITPRWRDIEEVFQAAESAAELASLGTDSAVIEAQVSAIEVYEVEDHMVYRPIVSLDSNDQKIFLLEPRISGEDGRVTLPRHQQDIIPEIDRWVLTHMVNTASELDKDVQVIVPLSSTSLTDDSFAQWLSNVAAGDLKWAPECLVLAFSESMLLEHTVQATELCMVARRNGFGLAINHYGSTSNGVSMLQWCSPDFVILDRQFSASGTLPGTSDSERIEGLIQAASKSGARVISHLLDNPIRVPVLSAHSVKLYQSHFVDHATHTILNHQFSDFVA